MITGMDREPTIEVHPTTGALLAAAYDELDVAYRAGTDERREGETMTGHKLLRYFRYEHLPADLQEVSRPFYELAEQLGAANVTDEAERTVALRKLLEAKDAAVRSVIV